ncbi:MAG: DUF7524 family protein, partial [Methanobacteriota archaeon]
MQGATAVLIGVLALSILHGPAASASAFSAGSCGLSIQIRNHDLGESQRATNHVTVQGAFYVQFQAVGPDASRVARLEYGFGKSLPQAIGDCAVPVGPVAGLYLSAYRADDTPEDGFFIPINTTVPDGDYSALLVARDAGGAELGRAWSDATVANAGGTDMIAPWPIVLPGDGEGPASSLTIEFAETVAPSDVRAYVSRPGAPETEVPLAEFVPPARDDDVVPYNPIDPSPVQKRVLGSGYEWKGALGPEAVVRVVARDAAGNRVERILHASDPTAGPRTVPVDADVGFVTAPGAPTALSADAPFPVVLANRGSGAAHVNLHLSGAVEALGASFATPHVVIPPGREATAEIRFASAPDRTNGASGALDVVARYLSGTNETTMAARFDVSLAPALAIGPAEVPERLDAEAPDAAATPTVGFAAFVVAIALLALLCR